MSPLDLIKENIDVLRRRWQLIARLTILGILLAVAVALQTPRTYVAVETIQIERPSVSDELVDGLGLGDSGSARQLQQIQERLFARETLLEIADDFRLFDDRPTMTDTEKATAMRQAVTVDTVAAAREGFTDDGTVSVLSVMAKWSDPVLVRDLAHEFASRTLQLSAGQRLESAQKALDFFSIQEESLKAEIQAIEDEREVFRRENTLTIDGSIDSMRQDMRALNESLLATEEDILAKQAEIEQIKSGDRSSEVAQLRAQIRIDAINDEIAGLTHKRDALTASRKSIEDALTRVPLVERQLRDYERSLESLDAELTTVSKRLREAQTTYALEARDQGGRMTVIEAATIPDYPSSMSRKLMVILGMFAGLSIGVGIAFLLEYLFPVIRSAGQMSRRTGLLPVVTIPAIGMDHATDPGRRGKRQLRGTL